MSEANSGPNECAECVRLRSLNADLLAACETARAAISECVLGTIFGGRRVGLTESEVESLVNRVVDELDAAIAKATGDRP